MYLCFLTYQLLFAIINSLRRRFGLAMITLFEEDEEDSTEDINGTELITVSSEENEGEEM